MELKRYWQIILKRHRTLLWIVGVILATVILGSLIATPVYMFYANVWIKTTDPKVNLVGGTNLPADLASLGIISADLVMYGQLAMIKNFTLVRKVIDDLGLKDRKGQPYSERALLNPNYFDLLIQKIGVKVSLLQNTQVIQVQGFSSSPEEAARIANRMAAEFVDLYNSNIQNSAKKAYQFIQESIPKCSDRLRQAEAELTQYKIDNHVNNISYLREKLLTSLVTIKDESDTNDREVAESEKRHEEIKAKLKKIPEFRRHSMELRNNPTLSYLREKLMDLESTLASTEVKLTPKHPAAQQFRASFTKLKEEYGKQVAKIFYGETSQRNNFFDTLLQNLTESEINLVIRTSRQQFIRQQLINRQTELDELTKIETKMEPLIRKVMALQNNLNNLMLQEQVTRLASELSLSNAMVVEKAAVPILASHLKKARWFPKRKILVMLALFSGLLLGLTVIFLQEYLDDSLSDPVEAEGFLDLPVLASLPELPPLEAYTLEAVMGYLPWTQAFWALPDMVKAPEQAGGAGVWAVTSAGAAEGKSLVAASLGWVLGITGQRVLLVDLNFTHPTLTSLWQAPSGEGVREVLQGTTTLAACRRQVGPGELYLVPNGQVEGILWPQWAPPVLAEWLAAEKADYDAVILDLPAIGEGEGAPLAALGEHILMVVAANHTPRLQAARALKQIQRCRGHVRGVVFNRSQKYELRPLVSQAVATVMSWALVQRLAAWLASAKAKLWTGK